MIQNYDHIKKMFKEVEPDVNMKHVRIVENDEYQFQTIGYFKDDEYCWGYTLAELTFAYITKDWS
jgi:hypothetical protein